MIAEVVVLKDWEIAAARAANAQKQFLAEAKGLGYTHAGDILLVAVETDAYQGASSPVLNGAALRFDGPWVDLLMPSSESHRYYGANIARVSSFQKL